MATDAELRIGANDDELRAGMQRAVEAVNSGVGQMQASFASLGAQFGRLNTLMLEFAAAVAGGKAFGQAVEETVNLTKEAQKLGRTLGISASEASVLNVALGDIYQSGDTVVAATNKITKTLKDNEGAFRELGVATRDQSGHFRNSLDVMLDVNTALLKFREGTDRNIEGQKIYGKAWAEVAPLLKLTTDLMEESRKKAEALGLVVGEENVQATAKYRAAMNDMHDVFAAIKKVIGDAVLPGLTNLGNWFSSIGPEAVMAMRAAMEAYNAVMDSVKRSVKALWDAVVDSCKAIFSAVMGVFGESSEPMTAMTFFKNVLKLIEVAFISLRIGFQIAGETISGTIRALVEDFKVFAAVADRALHLDFAGATAAWRAGMDRNVAIVRDSIARIVDIAAKGREDIDRALLGDIGAAPTVTKAKAVKDGAASSGGGDKSAADKSRLPEWDAQLAETKAYFQKTYDLKEYSKQQEKEYWQSILRNVEVSAQERIAISKKVAEAELEILKKSAHQKQALAGEAINAAEKAAEDGLKMEELLAQRDLELGNITRAQMLDLQEQYENRRHDIQTAAQAARIQAMQGDPNMDPVALQKQLDQMAEIHRKHALDLQKISNDRAKESAAAWERALSPISAALEKTVTGMIQGTLTLKKALSNIFQSILAEFVSMAAKMVVKWAAMELAKTAATQKNSVLRTVLEKMGLIEASAAQVTSSATTAAAKKAEAASVIPAEAAVAAGGAASSVAGIPIVGPALAAAAFAETMAMVMGGLAVASASAGYDIPAGVNPLTQLHENEMVLPAHIADPLRANLASGGGTGGGDIHLNITAMDAASVRDYFRRNSHALAPGLRELARNMGHS